MLDDASGSSPAVACSRESVATNLAAHALAVAVVTWSYADWWSACNRPPRKPHEPGGSLQDLRDHIHDPVTHSFRFKLSLSILSGT